MSKRKMPDRIAPKLWASVMVNEQMAKTNARGHWPLQSFQFLRQKNWTLLSMSIFCGILFGQTKTWPISMFTDGPVARLPESAR